MKDGSCHLVLIWPSVHFNTILSIHPNSYVRFGSDPDRKQHHAIISCRNNSLKAKVHCNKFLSKYTYTIYSFGMRLQHKFRCFDGLDVAYFFDSWKSMQLHEKSAYRIGDCSKSNSATSPEIWGTDRPTCIHFLFYMSLSDEATSTQMVPEMKLQNTNSTL